MVTGASYEIWQILRDQYWLIKSHIVQSPLVDLFGLLVTDLKNDELVEDLASKQEVISTLETKNIERREDIGFPFIRFSNITLKANDK